MISQPPAKLNDNEPPAETIEALRDRIARLRALSQRLRDYSSRIGAAAPCQPRPKP